MSRTQFVRIPNLPEHNVAGAVVSGVHNQEMATIRNNLREAGIYPIRTYVHKTIQPPVAAHADMLCHHFGKNTFLLALESNAISRLSHRLKQLGAQLLYTEKHLQAQYPADVGLNGARVGNRLFGNINALDPVLLQIYRQNGIAIYHTQQGYAKCNTAVVDSNSVITEDPSVATACQTCGVQVLKIRPGYVRLPGYPYGFIGGACGLIGPKQLAFCGDIRRHPDYPAIHSFLQQRHIDEICLADFSLLDIGGILPVLEYIP